MEYNYENHLFCYDIDGTDCNYIPISIKLKTGVIITFQSDLICEKCGALYD